MNRDLLLGAAASVLIHAGTVFGNLFNDGHRPPPIVPVNANGYIDIVPPPIEPDQPDPTQDTSDVVKAEFMHRTQIDLPDLPIPGGFVQPLQPSPARANLNPRNVPIDLDAIGGSRDRIFDAVLVDQIPQPRFRTPPTYPFDLRHHGVEGTVLVDFLVDTEGIVLNARAVSSSHREFESSAVQAVAKWKFRPGRKDGQNVITHMQVPIVFSLDQK